MDNTRVTILVCARKRDTGGQLNRPVSNYFDLYAIRIKLDASDRVLQVRSIGFMESDQLGADQIT